MIVLVVLDGEGIGHSLSHIGRESFSDSISDGTVGIAHSKAAGSVIHGGQSIECEFERKTIRIAQKIGQQFNAFLLRGTHINLNRLRRCGKRLFNQ